MSSTFKPLHFYNFSHYIYCFLSPHPAHITSCTYHILHASHPAGEMQQRILLFTREMPSNHVCTTCKRCTCSINCYVSVFTLDALHSTCDQSENQSNKGISHVRGCQRGGRHSRVLFCQVKYI